MNSSEDLLCVAEATDTGWLIRSPGPGYWFQGPLNGEAASPGGVLGLLEQAGVRKTMRLPPNVGGLVAGREGALRRQSVQFGQVLCELAAMGESSHASSKEKGASQSDNVFTAPSSGRIYWSPKPGAEPFVSVGQTIKAGDTVCLLEVMKTFNRIAFQGPGVPASAKIIQLLVEDGSDVDARLPLLSFE